MSQLVHVPFHGDVLQVVHEGEVWVVFRPLCEALGLDPNGQRQRLMRQAWACACVMHAHDSSGREQGMFCIHRDSVPMWLATISASRVRPEVREKLALYQRECARVLRDHFAARSSAPAFDASAVAAITQLAAVVSTLASAVGDLAHRVGFLEQRVGFIENHIATSGEIPRARLLQLQRDIKSLGLAEVATGRWPKGLSAARADIYREMRDAVGWGGKGQAWATLPANLEPAARSVLRRRRADTDRALLAGRRQLELVASS